MKKKTNLSDHVTIIPSSVFRFDSSRSLLLSDRSTISKYNLFSNLYDGDRVTVGFGVKSERTGRVKYFYHTKTNNDSGTIMFWIFTALDGSKYQVKIINDKI